MKISMSRTITVAGMLLGLSVASQVLAQDPVAISLSDETAAADGVAGVAVNFQGNGESLGFQCDINYDATGIADIDLSNCLGGQNGTCVFPGGGDASGGVIRIAAFNLDSSPIADWSGEMAVSLDGSLADGDVVAFDWGGTCIATDPDAAVNDTSGSVTVGDTGACMLSIAPPSHNFGTIDIGANASQAFTISNGGDGDCTNLSVAVSGAAAFSLAGTDCGATLGVGASCSATVGFSSAAEGTFGGFLNASADGSEASAELSGTVEEGVIPPTVAIPTMQPWGLALMALLMLMIGVVSVRTFRS